MTILCIETSTNVCSAAVTIGGVPVAERISREGGNHAKLLPVFIDELLQEVRAKRLEIIPDCVSVPVLPKGCAMG